MSRHAARMGWITALRKMVPTERARRSAGGAWGGGNLAARLVNGGGDAVCREGLAGTPGWGDWCASSVLTGDVRMCPPKAPAAMEVGAPLTVAVSA